MTEGRRKLNLTMKITDSVVKLTGIVSAYSEPEASKTVRNFNGWVEETRELLKIYFDNEKANGFNRLEKPSKKNISPVEINNLSRIHADYLQKLIGEVVS